MTINVEDLITKLYGLDDRYISLKELIALVEEE